jgi:hypothetical protein
MPALGSGGGSAPIKPVSSISALQGIGAPNRLAPPVPDRNGRGGGGTFGPPPPTPAWQNWSKSNTPAVPGPTPPANNPYVAGSPVSANSGGVYAPPAPMDTPPAPQAPPAPPQLNQNDWVAQDAGYATDHAGIGKTLADLIAQLTSQRAGYDQNFGNSLNQLGWKGDNLGTAGGWDNTNMQGAYGQAYQNQENDFAGRGMMGSSFYDRANTNLDNNFNQQKGNMTNDRLQNVQNSTQQQASGQIASDNAESQALANSYARRAAMYGLQPGQ